ncbi:hypothetical protein Pint_09573 [Pistacia integerrima]|uniref:Uncharacterized protein n=1 Tax=Pistacia integerrima TaxID=434235 RepID=A0ACC0XIL2_9ROSI|nr:hypothetical protein Pint_09573 [Pistacia integerrima]
MIIPNTSITNYSDCHTRKDTNEAISETRRKMGKAIKESVRFSLRVNPSTNNNSNNQIVNTQHSSPVLASSPPHLLHFSLFHMHLPYL